MRPCELDKDGMLLALQNHREALERMDVKFGYAPLDLAAPASWQQIRHCRILIEDAIVLVNAGHLDRANRWLGWIQATLWCNGLISIKDLKRINSGTYSQEVLKRPQLLIQPETP